MAIKKILITGATGNVGTEVIKWLLTIGGPLHIIAGVRDPGKDGKKLAPYNVSLRKFDFIDIDSYRPALDECDLLFLLRPPQISDTAKYFKPLINIAKAAGIRHILFLSVQGVQHSKLIPHHKIEKLIVESSIPYVFLRPAYFMQNFTTTLHADLVNKRRIFLPAGNTKFTLIDIRDIGAVTASVVSGISNHINKTYELTCDEKLTFKTMAEKLSCGLGIAIQYHSPGLLEFYLAKKREKMPLMLIIVMIMLHYFPRFKEAPGITGCVQEITGRRPVSFEEFITDNKTLLTS